MSEYELMMIQSINCRRDFLFTWVLSSVPIPALYRFLPHLPLLLQMFLVI